MRRFETGLKRGKTVIPKPPATEAFPRVVYSLDDSGLEGKFNLSRHRLYYMGGAGPSRGAEPENFHSAYVPALARRA